MLVAVQPETGRNTERVKKQEVIFTRESKMVSNAATENEDIKQKISQRELELD